MAALLATLKKTSSTITLSTSIIQGSTVAGLANNTAGSSSDALNSPVGIVVDDSSSLYIADEYNYRIQLWSSGASSGKTIAGNTSSSGNANNQLNTPTDIALDSNTATLYIADSFNHRVMRYLSGTSAGTLVAGNNSAGTGNTQLWQPTSVYFDSPTNSLLIANTYAHNIVRWVLGDSCWTLVAGNLNGSSGNTFRELQYSRTVTLDPMGNVYVADTVNHRIQFFLNGETNGTTIAGHTGSPARNATGLFYPSKIVLDSQLYLYVADTDNQRIQKFLRY
ncbi:unnamed protein product [Rotaria sp. Silwood1]|nr:unnamed protein product [Rotaria sp. Silwood1]